MSTVDLSKIRNIGIIAHIDAGKTTTSEHLLFYSGAKHKLGGVDQGTTETDYDIEEQQRGITIYSACVPLSWMGHTLNLIDTPGHVDFTAEVERSLRVLDGCICVFDAQKGVEAQSEKVWGQANKYGVPRLVFINKMDVVGANFANTLAQIKDRLEGNPVPVFIPIGAGSPKETQTYFTGIIDLLTMKALYFESADFGKTIRQTEIPSEYVEEAQKYRENLFDVLSQNDEADLITTAYLEGQEIPIENIRKLLREQTLKRLIQPVFCGSGREHVGIQPLLDGIVYYLPSPLDRPPVVGTNPKKNDKTESRKPDLKEPFAGLVFKVIAQDSGDLFFVRIYSGTLKPNTRVLNAGKDSKEVVGKLYHIHADPSQRDDLPSTHAGDIVVMIGLKDAVTGDTLCETQHPILLEPISFAQTVVSQSIEPESSADKDKLNNALSKLQREDPTFVCEFRKDTGQLLMSGMGTLHLEVKRHKLERDYRLKVRVGKPQVSYRESLREKVTIEGLCDRQIGNTAAWAKVIIQFEPKKLEQPVTVTNKLKPNTVLPMYSQAIERTLKSAMQSGEYGNPILDVHATILDAVQDPERSSEPAFEYATDLAVRNAFNSDNLKLLEPMMKLTVAIPDEYVGPVMSYILARRGDIRDQQSNGRSATIIANVPLKEVLNYADELASLTQGRASSSLEPNGYGDAPDEILRKMRDGEI